MKVRKALIPAAGLGTRFLSATKVVPKELLPIVDRPAMEYIVEELANSGIEEVTFILSTEKEMIFDHFQSGSFLEQMLHQRGQIHRMKHLHDLMERVTFKKVYQPEPKGLGHAVLCGRAHIGSEPFVVVLPDDLVRSKTPCVKQLISVFEKEHHSVVAVEEVPKENVKFYGIVGGKKTKGKKYFQVDQIVEKPSILKAPSRMAVIGRYLLDPMIFEILETTRPGAGGEIQLTDALSVLSRLHQLIALPFEGRRVDTGQPHGWLEANLLFALDRKEIRDQIRPVIKTLARI